MSQLNPTLGEKKVGWYFIKSGDTNLHDFADGIKTQTAALIDLISHFEEVDIELAHKAQNVYAEACKLTQELMIKNIERKKRV